MDAPETVKIGIFGAFKNSGQVSFPGLIARLS